MIDYARAQGRLEAGGVDLFAGDFHETLPEGPFDLVFCAGVTHTMSAERNRDLYPRLREIVAPGGGFVIATFLRHRGPIPPIFAIQMLVGGQGGDTFGEDDYRAWLIAAGFELSEVVEVTPKAQTLLVATAG